MPETVQAVGAVQLQRHRAEQSRQFARRRAPLQVHLKEPLLGVDEAGGPSHIQPVVAEDGRDAQCIALDGDRGAQAGQHRPAVQPGQAAVQLEV